MTSAQLEQIRDLIQNDVGNRGLATDPEHNLLNACPDDFANACRSIAEQPRTSLAIVTGFYINRADPPAAETDGPLGAIFLARALLPLGIRVAFVTDAFCVQPLRVGLDVCGLADFVEIVVLPNDEKTGEKFLLSDWPKLARDQWALTHLLAVERVGPNHASKSLEDALAMNFPSIEAVSLEKPDRCYNAMGMDITDFHTPAHRLFETRNDILPHVVTIGIGDGGNEIGMGKIPFDIMKRNIPHGEQIACRVATDHLLVCGVSNWGAYGLAAGVSLLKKQPLAKKLFSVEEEEHILREMVRRGPLVDGVLATPTVSVDGLPFHEYIAPLQQLANLC